MPGRRSSDDPLWVEAKKQIDKRDKHQCQFERCLTAKEFHQLRPGSPKNLDRAHIFSAANFPNLLYTLKNVITLRRYIHQRMDDYQCPLTGDPIEINQHYWWWIRILNHSTEAYNELIDYEELLKTAIK